MPGAIQVTVLEFKGVSSLSKPSAKSLRVSMGKREFQTWDKGEFSFPITKLNEDLVVALLDAAGNDIAHSDIRTMHIIEKGVWDEVFSINGCGHVHMKLQFVLSEEDRTRIRIMRESVVKQKIKENSNINVKLSETSGGSVETLKETVQDSDSENGSGEIGVLTPKVGPFQSASSSDSTIDRKEGGPNLESAIPDTTDGGQGAPLSPGNEGVESESARPYESLPDYKMECQPTAYVNSIADGADSVKLSGSDMSDSVTFKSRDEPMQEPQRLKVPSNVRKMISAFESSQIQDMGRMDSNQEAKSIKKTPSVQAQVNRPRKESLLEEDPETKADVSPVEEYTRQSTGIVSSGTRPPQVSTATPVMSVGKDSTKPDVEELQKLPTDGAESSSGTATSSGMMEKQSRGARAYEEASNSGTKSLELYEEECASGQSSGLWIFPDDRRHMCITTAGEHNEKIARHHWYEGETCQGKEISSESEVLEKNVIHGTEEKNQKQSADRLPDDPSHGLVGKVIKIAAILGFGLLVLLTRQKEPRDSKSSYQKENHTEEIENLFSIPNYENERT